MKIGVCLLSLSYFWSSFGMNSIGILDLVKSSSHFGFSISQRDQFVSTQPLTSSSIGFHNFLEVWKILSAFTDSSIAVLKLLLVKSCALSLLVNVILYFSSIVFIKIQKLNKVLGIMMYRILHANAAVFSFPPSCPSYSIMATGRLAVVSKNPTHQKSPLISFGCLNWMIDAKSLVILSPTLTRMLITISFFPPSGSQYQKSLLISFTSRKISRSDPMYTVTQVLPRNPRRTIVVHLIMSMPAVNAIIVPNTIVLLVALEGMYP
mmetsp:Transcript_6745/g.13497  ORF Transcript_6745/g.13497 Transcript_6745/m.13497 type:complete len:264 (+) Transcript_6745:85-876(+)